MVVDEEDVPRGIGCSYSKPPMCGIGGDVDIYARRSMRCRELVISELGARLAGCELVVVSSMHNCSDARGMMLVWVCRVVSMVVVYASGREDLERMANGSRVGQA